MRGVRISGHLDLEAAGRDEDVRRARLPRPRQHGPSREGGVMVRVDSAQSDALVATTTATPMNMRGRDMPGWLRVSADDLRSDD
jgi:hypothetical protein